MTRDKNPTNWFRLGSKFSMRVAGFDLQGYGVCLRSFTRVTARSVSVVDDDERDLSRLLSSSLPSGFHRNTRLIMTTDTVT
jgi:hypothetical protein